VCKSNTGNIVHLPLLDLKSNMSSFCFEEAIVVNNLSAERLSEVENLNNVNINKCREEMSSLFSALREAGVVRLVAFNSS